MSAPAVCGGFHCPKPGQVLHRGQAPGQQAVFTYHIHSNASRCRKVQSNLQKYLRTSFVVLAFHADNVVRSCCPYRLDRVDNNLQSRQLGHVYGSLVFGIYPVQKLRDTVHLIIMPAMREGQ